MDRMSPLVDEDRSVADSIFFSRLEEECRIYIVRHGQSEGNARMIIQGRKDLSLDEAGRAQAAAVGAWLAGQGLSSILASPLSRAAETATIIASACRLGAPTLDPLFMEIDTGTFSGLSLDEARIAFPEVYEAFRRRSWEGVPDAEPAALIYERAMAAWRVLRERAQRGERAFACVTHGGFIQWLVRATFGCKSWMPLLSTGNCGIFELLVAPNGLGEPAYLHWRHINFQPAGTHRAVPPVF